MYIKQKLKLNFGSWECSLSSSFELNWIFLNEQWFLENSFQSIKLEPNLNSAFRSKIEFENDDKIMEHSAKVIRFIDSPMILNDSKSYDNNVCRQNDLSKLHCVVQDATIWGIFLSFILFFYSTGLIVINLESTKATRMVTKVNPTTNT